MVTGGWRFISSCGYWQTLCDSICSSVDGAWLKQVKLLGILCFQFFKIHEPIHMNQLFHRKSKEICNFNVSNQTTEAVKIHIYIMNRCLLINWNLGKLQLPYQLPLLSVILVSVRELYPNNFRCTTVSNTVPRWSDNQHNDQHLWKPLFLVAQSDKVLVCDNFWHCAC